MITEHIRNKSSSSLLLLSSFSSLSLFRSSSRPLGGWANRWYNDVYSLSVKSIVGPPYAVLDVSPKVNNL